MKDTGQVCCSIRGDAHMCACHVAGSSSSWKVYMRREMLTLSVGQVFELLSFGRATGALKNKNTGSEQIKKSLTWQVSLSMKLFISPLRSWTIHYTITIKMTRVFANLVLHGTLAPTVCMWTTKKGLLGIRWLLLNQFNKCKGVLGLLCEASKSEDHLEKHNSSHCHDDILCNLVASMQLFCPVIFYRLFLPVSFMFFYTFCYCIYNFFLFQILTGLSCYLVVTISCFFLHFDSLWSLADSMKTSWNTFVSWCFKTSIIGSFIFLVEWIWALFLN